MIAQDIGGKQNLVPTYDLNVTKEGTKLISNFFGKKGANSAASPRCVAPATKKREREENIIEDGTAHNASFATPVKSSRVSVPSPSPSKKSKASPSILNYFSKK